MDNENQTTNRSGSPASDDHAISRSSICRRSLLTGAVCAGAGHVLPSAAAGEPERKVVTGPIVKSVVELFTSQGCSSCPAADALFQSYCGRDDLIALSYAVDYWDYLGWKDTLANPKYAKRQRAYAKARGDGKVYTPQIVVNGGQHASGADKTGIDDALEFSRTQSSSRWTRVKIEARDEQLHTLIDASGGSAGRPQDTTIWLAAYTRQVKVVVERGENAGKTLTYFNVVRDLSPLGMWDGAAQALRLDTRAVMQSGADACAVLLQQGHGGPIIGAAKLRSV